MIMMYRSRALLLAITVIGLTITTSADAFQAPNTPVARSTWANNRAHDETRLFSAPALDNEENPVVVSSNSKDKIHPRLVPPNYGWTKPTTPKQSLSRPDIQQSHTAKPWILNLVQAAHWSLAIPLVANSYVFVSQFETWLDVVHHDYGKMLLLILYPMVIFMSALFPIVSHSFDDWTLAPFRDDNDDNNLQLQYPAQDYGNDRLHRFGYNMLFLFLSVSALMVYHALDFGGVNLLPASVVMVLYGTLGDQNHLVSHYLASPVNPKSDEPIVPVPVCTTVLFAYSQVLWVVALVGLMLSGGLSTSSLGLWAAMGVAVVGQTLGGVYEGVVAESTFNQWDHLKSIAFMFAGFSAEAYFFWEYARQLQL